ncbi:MAG: hypothetical protein Kow0092_06760 [Deferrisomatales bacterium]
MKRTPHHLSAAALGLVFLSLLAARPAPALEAVPQAVLRGNPEAVEALAGGASVRAVWIAGKFGEYGDPAHVIRFDRDGNPVEVEGKFIRLGDDRFSISVQGHDWLVRGKFGDGGSDAFRIRRTPAGRIASIEGRFYHNGDDRFAFRYDDEGRLTAVEGKFGQDGEPGVRFLRDASGRITEVRGKLLRFGDSRFRVTYYGATPLVRSIEGRFARWGDRRFSFYYEAWPE